MHVVTICLVDGQTDVESQYELCEHKLQYESSGTSVQGRGHTVQMMSLKWQMHASHLWLGTTVVTLFTQQVFLNS